MHTFAGLVSVLIVFVWLGGNQVSPLRPICDLRVLDHFVREARDSEVIMFQGQAVEVQTGLSLLVQALSTVKKTVSNAPLASTLDNNISNIHSLGQILHSLDLQQARSTVLPDDSAPASSQMQEVSSLPELLQVQSSFLRGKVRLLLSAAPACQRQNS
ncbi:erythropoietin b isoform X3 [Pseudorasbora parva]|uniref:erythropoietin b isoform X3 n=1 Tax=Pseudorasbora parva TaxID=51549 RepID=UPI00351E920C